MKILRILLGLFLFNSLYASDIIVVTMSIGNEYSEMVNEAIKNKEEYCKKHGYDFICLQQSLDRSRPIPWSKVLLLLDVMENHSSKWIFWTDADALFMNFTKTLEQFIDDKYNLIITRDFNDINTGHFFLRNCDWSRRFLEVVYSHVEYINSPWWEQHGFIHEINHSKWVIEKTKIEPQRTFNSYPKELFGYLGKNEVIYHRGDFIIHLPSAPRQSLKQLLHDYNKLAIK